jgi:hypothetical protein
MKSSPVTARKPKDNPAVSSAPLPAKRVSHLASPSALPRKSIRSSSSTTSVQQQRSKPKVLQFRWGSAQRMRGRGRRAAGSDGQHHHPTCWQDWRSSTNNNNHQHRNRWTRTGGIIWSRYKGNKFILILYSRGLTFGWIDRGDWRIGFCGL